MANVWELDIPLSLFTGASTNYALLRYSEAEGVYYEFDNSVVKTIIQADRLFVPDIYSGGTLKLDCFYYCPVVTSGNVEFRAYVDAVAGGASRDMTTAVYDTANAQVAAVPGTAKDPAVLSITLSNKTGFAANGTFRLKIDRNTATSGNAAGLVRLTALRLREEA